MYSYILKCNTDIISYRCQTELHTLLIGWFVASKQPIADKTRAMKMKSSDLTGHVV